eukprot:Sspe_Gene.24247::Locus_9579_Transcript_1_1_Confidence_1.000_Length_11937::g.24247::m.24247
MMAAAGISAGAERPSGVGGKQEGAALQYSADMASSPTYCEPAVMRVGEVFVDLGYVVPRDGLPDCITKWGIRVKDAALQVVLQDEWEVTPKPSKVFKLRAGQAYRFSVRLFNSKTGLWGAYSSEAVFRTHSEPITKCTEIGEDYAMFSWGRPARPAEVGAAEEIDPDASERVRALEGYQLKVLRYPNMEVEFHQEFDSGVRNYMLYSLQPGCRYVVMARWENLLGSLKQWQECLRIETQTLYSVKLLRRREDSLSITWGRAPPPPDDGQNWQKPTTTPIRLEVVVEGGSRGHYCDAVEMRTNSPRYDVTNLLPNTLYSIRIRACCNRGRWGVFSDPLSVKTLSMLQVSVDRLAELYTVLKWRREVETEQAADKRYQISVLGVSTKFSYEVELSSEEVKEKGCSLYIPGLKAEQSYKAFARAMCDEEWGLWSEAVTLTTKPRPRVTCKERGEDFLSIAWDSEGTPDEVDRFQVQVLKIPSEGQYEVVHDKKYNGTCPAYRVPTLSSNTAYGARVRVCHGHLPGVEEEVFGEWSDLVVTTTLRSLRLQLVDIGEDFVVLEWRRATEAVVDIPDDTPGVRQGGWYDLKYEVVLGCVDSGEERVVHKELVDTTYRLANLLPSTTYSIAVRACDGAGQWGLWCTEYFRTLSSVTLLCHEVGEDYARVMWERAPVGPASANLPNVLGAQSYVSKYHLFLYCTDPLDEEDIAGMESPHLSLAKSPDDTVSFPLARNSDFKIEKMLDPSHTSFRIPGLIPDRSYAVVVRAATQAGIWGLWSEPVRFHTVSPFTVPIRELSLGESYVQVKWGRDEAPTLEGDVKRGDYTVTSQQIVIQGVDSDYCMNQTLAPRDRELKVYGLKPSHRYTVKIRACNSNGEWGTWSREAHFQTRSTIVMRAIEIAEAFIIVRWERKEDVECDKKYQTGKGYISKYHLRVTNDAGYEYDDELVEADCPFKIANLNPNTRYTVTIKANYNDDEWGLWSRPLECLTLRLIEIRTTLIGEDFTTIKWHRPEQSHHVAINRRAGEEDPVVCFGQVRQKYQLRVLCQEAARASQLMQISWGSDPTDDDSDRKGGEKKIVMEETVTDPNSEVHYTVRGLKPDTLYTIIVRSKIDGGDWGVWSTEQRLVTLKPQVITFVAIGEDLAQITWERPAQVIADPKIARGKGTITKSQLKIKSPSGQVHTYDINSITASFTVEELKPATTYLASVRTFNDNNTWGLWSTDRSFTTTPGLEIEAAAIGEDYLSISFFRRPQLNSAEEVLGTTYSTNTTATKYQIRCNGEDGFSYTHELAGDAPRSFQLTGLIPSSTYEVAVRGFSKYGMWGQWSTANFITMDRLKAEFGNIGEQFAVVRWTRPIITSPVSWEGQLLRSNIKTVKYRLHVAEVANPSNMKLIDLDPDLTEFMITDLNPNTEYAVSITSQHSSGGWGLWSPIIHVVTLPPLLLEIKDIGESYTTVSWMRDDAVPHFEQPSPEPGSDGAAPVFVGSGEVEEFHVVVEGRYGMVIERFLPPDTGSCKLDGLQADTYYRVMVRMKDTKGEWGLWSTALALMTLPPTEFRILKVGEDFIDINWMRKDTQRKYRFLAEVDFGKINDTDTEGDDEEEEEVEEEELEEGEEEEAEEEEEEEDKDKDWEIPDPASIAFGSLEVQRWLIRIQSNKVGWEETQCEYELEGTVLNKRITGLDPDTSYTISVRGLSSSGEWGFWRTRDPVNTLPLIQVEVPYVGEDFVIVTWSRPETTTALPLNIANFPPASAMHNYNLWVSPLPERDDEEHTSNLMDREFDVTQPKYEVWDMTPGTRYRIGVQERDLEGNWGRWSELLVVQTLEPLTLRLADVGECFGNIVWVRAAQQTEPSEKVVTSKATTTQYQLQAEQLGKGMSTPYKLLKTFDSGCDSFDMTGLVPDTIYSVRIRCQTDSEYWGGWSEPLLFSTMKLLNLYVTLINEDNFVVSWYREDPDWVTDPRLYIDHGLAGIDLQKVNLGQYVVQEYEIKVEQLSGDNRQEAVHRSGSLAQTYRIPNLTANTLYAVCVRSKNALGVWSLWSRKESVLTLNSLCLQLGRVTETTTELRWFRFSQDPEDFLGVLEEHIENEDRLASREDGATEGTAAVPPHLLIENVHIAKGDVTAYHLRAWGDRGCPIDIPACLKYDPTPDTRRRGKPRLKAGFKKRKDASGKSVRTGKKKVRSPRESEVASNATRDQEEDEVDENDDPDEDAERCLIDTFIKDSENKLQVQSLLPGTQYTFAVRARNSENEWGLWCSKVTVTTEVPIKLLNDRFGEHYINLYWYRPTPEEDEQEARRIRFLAEHESEAQQTAGEGEAENPTMALYKQWRAEQDAIDQIRKEGRGDVCSTEHTAVTGYLLRVISEEGVIDDRALPVISDTGDPVPNCLTVPSLTPNSFYTARIAPCYGDGVWGSWSEPLNFITQNQLQLSISYVGESFIQLDWKRAPCKKLRLEGVGNLLTSPTEQGIGHTYQLMVTHDKVVDGLPQKCEEYVAVVDSTNFRITGLMSDIKYILAVREWDTKGEWGLWSAPCSCLTLGRMEVTVKEIGEDWVSVGWQRQPPRVKYEESSIISIPVSITSFFLRVDEVEEGDLDSSTQHIESHSHTGTEQEDIDGNEGTASAYHLRQQRKLEEDRECLRQLEDDVLRTKQSPFDSRGKFRQTLKLNPNVSHFKLTNLRPSKLCNIRVQAETSGGELGVWSPDCLFVTQSKIKVSIDLVGEDTIALSWIRPETDIPDGVQGVVHEGDPAVLEYEAEICGRGSESHLHMCQRFTPGDTSWKIKSLKLDSVYSFRIRSRDENDRWSLWSDPMEILTLGKMRVEATKVTEQLMMVKWGRKEQRAEDYPQRTPGVPLMIPQERVMQYHLRVWSAGDRKATLVDKTFVGTTTHYAINYLTPNTSYVVEARACNPAGEWGVWSDKEEMYTMKLLQLDVDAVGEDYVKVRWWREVPDVKGPNSGKYTMEDGKQVYTTPDTVISNFAINVVVLGKEDWEWSTEVSGDVYSYRIPDLQPDRRYSVSIRACYGDEDWGTWSAHVSTATLNVISVQAIQAGEDYLTAKWHRLDNTFESEASAPKLHMGTVEETLGYQYRVTLCSETKGDELVVTDKQTQDDHVTISGLTPNERYRIEVRYWYRPIEKSTSRVEEVTDADAGGQEGEKHEAKDDRGDGEKDGGKTDEKEAGKVDAEGGKDQPTVEGCEVLGEPGVWGEATHVATLKPMVAIVDEIAEDFISLRWERDPNARSFPAKSVASLAPEVQAYHVRIDQMVTTGEEKDMGEESLHIDHEFGPAETAFRVTNLLPDTVYRIEVRACCDSCWGLWSKPCLLITLPKLSINITSIGEDYVVIAWGRKKRQLQGLMALIGSSENVSRYHLEMFGVNQPFHTDKKFKSSRVSYKVKRLDANSMYTLRVRSCDANNIWSLWSEKACFVTLKPVKVSFGKVGEQFVHIKWSREAQTPEEYSHDPAPQLPDPTVTKYHMCVFAAEHAPTSALIDKQFPSDVTSYKVSNLNPNSMYIVIVRAANAELQWGLWSEERTVLTLPLLQTHVNSVGENYIAIGWSREEHATPLQAGIVVPPTAWHVVVTGQDLQYDKQLPASEVVDQEKPSFVVRSLKPDSKYIVTLRPCYGDDEWGLWTNPITFLTLNQLGLTVSNISEEHCDFTWGRGPQSAHHTYDPGVVVWKGVIHKYALSLRKVNEGPEQAEESNFCVDREMEMNQYKYIQTYCTIDNLKVNTEYIVRVRALDDYGEWGEYTELQFETPPLPPGRAVLKKAHSNFVAFDWEPPDPFNRYLYCVEQAISRSDRGVGGKTRDDRGGSSGDSHLDWKVVDTVNEPYAKIKTTVPLAKCRFRVKCCKMDRPVHLWSRYSPIASFTTAVPPDSVTSLTVTSLSRTSATLEWKPPTGATPQPGKGQAKPTFKILLGERDGQPHVVGTTKAYHYELTNLKPNTHYRVQVQVETDSGLSARNTILKFSTRVDT